MINKALAGTSRMLGLALLTAVISSPAFAQAFYEPDCNDPDAHDINCTEPVKALITDAQSAGYPYYVGHAEPTTLFFSKAAASGNNMQWKFKIPATDPAPDQAGTSVANFELYSTFWAGLALCDPNSSPYGNCIADSDTNNPNTAGAAFLELQFYPPGLNCSDPTKWCVNLHINTLQNVNAFQKTNCFEPTTAAYVTTNGLPAGPQLVMNNGDTILVTIHDTANGLEADVTDLTTAATGTMIASGANGYLHNANQTDCTTAAFDFHPMYATAAPGQVVPWAALGPNVSFDFEIGHFELCGNSTCTTLPDNDSDDTNCATVQGIGGCFGSDLDHNGPPYQADWPNGSAAFPASLVLGAPNDQGVGPLSFSATGLYNAGYPTIVFQTTEATTGAFYPFWSQIGTGALCIFNFGNDNPGETNNFGKAAQYGTATQNTCFPAAATPPLISEVFGPDLIGVNTNTTLTFAILNTSAVALTGVSFTDTLPGGLTLSAGSAAVCGGALTTVFPGGIALSGAVIAGGSTCSFAVTVAASVPGIFTNATGPVMSDQTVNGNTASATLTVLAPPAINKFFAPPNKILPGGASQLSFTVTNPNSFAPLPGVGFTDTLPGLLVLATTGSTPPACGGSTVTAVAGTGIIDLSNATLAAGASCTFTVTVTGPEGIYFNSVTVASTVGGTGNTSTDTLSIATPPSLGKGFGEVSIPVNLSTILTFDLSNPNNVLTLHALQFTDTLPAGLVISTPSVVTGTCGIGTINAIAGTTLITLTGAALAPHASCTFSVRVSGDGTGQGYLTNTTSPLSSTEALPGGAASAVIFIGDPFQISYAANLAVGDSFFDVTNVGAAGSTLQYGTTAVTPGSICVNIYAFTPDEQLVSCCSCPVTPDGLTGFSAKDDLAGNTLTTTVPTALVVKVLATLPVGGSCFNSAAAVTTGLLANGMKAYGTTIHATPAAGTYGVTEHPFSAGTLSAGELSRLGNLCSFTIANGSGFGICGTCRLGALGAERQ